MRASLNDLAAFAAVARERSFTRAAAQLGVSPSALSHSMRGLEERLGVRLLTRTTRNVVPTEAGERLLASVGPRIGEIEAELEALVELRDKPAGSLRITAGEYAVESILMPALTRLIPDYPDIKVEVVMDYGLTDIVSERFDAGIRIGDTIAKDMIAVPLGGPMTMAVVGSPAYFERHPPPKTPDDLVAHNCINLRLPTYGGLYAWEFDEPGREFRVRVQGQLTFNTAKPIIQSALAGLGLACLPDADLLPYIADGRLVRVLGEWTLPFPGYRLYYPSRRQQSPALSLLIEALRYRG